MSTRWPEEAPWWTEADQAELDMGIWELTGVVEAHKDCEACAEARTRGRYHCEPICRAIDALVDWKTRRSLLSRAQFLRALWNVRGPK